MKVYKPGGSRFSNLEGSAHPNSYRQDKMPSMMDIIIVNYNSTDCLLNCLDSVYGDLSGMPATLWIVDNGSTDGIDRVPARFPEVHLIMNQQNLGFGAAVNQALKHTSSAHIVLLNPDSLVIKGFFHTMIAFMEENPRIGIAGPGIRNADGSVQGSARSFPTPLTALFGRSTLLSRLLPGNPLTRANVLTTVSDGVSPMDVDWVSGACMVVRRKAIDTVGGFDERFFMYWEDADWCRRMRHGGWRIAYFPLAEVIHHAGVSSGKRALGSLFEFHKSAYRLYEKYTPSASWPLKILILAGLLARFCLVALIKRP
jgi:GT2 family glycosyltransferase